jgi:hypothetical protein
LSTSTSTSTSTAVVSIDGKRTKFEN